jgi:hypothetical protein
MILRSRYEEAVKVIYVIARSNVLGLFCTIGEEQGSSHTVALVANGIAQVTALETLAYQHILHAHDPSTVELWEGIGNESI